MHEHFWTPGDNLPAITHVALYFLASNMPRSSSLLTKHLEPEKHFQIETFLISYHLHSYHSNMQAQRKKRPLSSLSFKILFKQKKKKISILRHASSHRPTAPSYSNAFSADRSQIKLMKSSSCSNSHWKTQIYSSCPNPGASSNTSTEFQQYGKTTRTKTVWMLLSSQAPSSSALQNQHLSHPQHWKKEKAKQPPYRRSTRKLY